MKVNGLFAARRVCALCLSALVALSALADAPVRRVTVTSQPAGATVVVDGQDRGVTPLTLFDLAPGRHHLKYRLAGYVEYDRFFNTEEEGAVIEKNAVLVEERGLLLIKTDPAGCNIAIDGVTVGRSPRLVTHLASKDTYSVRLSKAGYQTQTITVKFNGREPLVREETLVLDSGVINVQSDPPGAEVTVNGIVRGVTPVVVKDIAKGRAAVKFRLEGFEDEVRELAMQAGDRQELQVVLKALPGTLHLVSVPEGGRFYVNDEARGAGPLTLAGLKPGDYLVRCEKEGFGTLTRTVTIANGASAREEFRLSNVMGRLEVRTQPPGATIILDGRTVGQTKGANDAKMSDAFPVENVLEGEHTLVLRKAGYKEIVRHPNVHNSKTATGSFVLERIFTPDVEIVTARGSYRGVLVSNSPEAVVVEVSLGINRSFPRDEIRKMTFLSDAEK